MKPQSKRELMKLDMYLPSFQGKYSRQIFFQLLVVWHVVLIVQSTEFLIFIALKQVNYENCEALRGISHLAF